MLSTTVDFRQRMVSGGLPGLIPAGFVKGVVGFGVTAKMTQAQAEMVVGFAVVRISVAPREPGNRFAKEWLRGGKFTAFEVPQTHRVVAARIQRVTVQCLPPIERRAARGVTVLVEM